ncbi:transglycosylase domain-containing protein [Cytophaga aurantiaca]|uniref:transglycosylase domain-containing protein n=1 Tax=Cytophaga aurantiaca TaxID=29530 RepID=UPI00035E9B7C|nr:transglycosylase domain-containing protein [Cytophaga aurantiaca]
MIRKFLKWATIFSALLLIGMYIFLYIWFHKNIDVVMTKNQQKWLVTEISNSPKFPDKVYNTLEKYDPEFYSDNAWNYNLKRIFGRSKRRCQCNEIYLPYIPGDTVITNTDRPWVPFNQDDLLIKLFIEKNFTQKECFTFNMNTSEFGGNTNGIHEASKYYFEKSLEELTEREIVGLYVIQFAPSQYNPLRNRVKYDEAVDAIMKK